MKKTLLLISALLLLTPSVLRAEDKPVLTTTITVGERPFWKKALRVAARVATLGVVQAATDTIKQGEAFSLAFDHNGVDTTFYEERINTQLTQSLPVAMLSNGSAMFPHPGGLAKGSYTFTVTAVGPGGTGVSAPFGLSVTAGNPAAPGQIRIIKGQ